MSALNNDSLDALLGQVIRLHHQRTHSLFGKLGLYPGQPPILFKLWTQDGQSQKELSDKLKIAPATVTVMLRRMEKAGLLKREQDSKDARISRVYLTEQGKSIQAQVQEAFQRVDQACFEGFTVEERLLLRRFLLHIKENLMNCGKE